MKYYTFVEPANKKCDPQSVVMSRDTVIQCRKEVHDQRGLPYFDDDEEFVKDFIAIHWAQELKSLDQVVGEDYERPEEKPS